jgi:hypothetical protein
MFVLPDCRRLGVSRIDLLVNNSRKIGKMVVGIHFYQTHPRFIETFLGDRRVRFVMNPDGIFHPKTYLFELAGGSWQLLVGSPNFTQAGTDTNDEMAVLVSSKDDGAREALITVKASIDGYWNKASSLSKPEWEHYREVWNRKQTSVKNLRDKTGLPQQKGSTQRKPTLVQQGNRSENAIFSDTILSLLSQYGPMTTLEMYPYIKQRHPDLCNDNIPYVWRGRDMGPLWQHRVRTAQQNMLKRPKRPLRYDKASGLWTKL